MQITFFKPLFSISEESFPTTEHKGKGKAAVDNTPNPAFKVKAKSQAKVEDPPSAQTAPKASNSGKGKRKTNPDASAGAASSGSKRPRRTAEVKKQAWKTFYISEGALSEMLHVLTQISYRLCIMSVPSFFPGQPMPV